MQKKVGYKSKQFFPSENKCLIFFYVMRDLLYVLFIALLVLLVNGNKREKERNLQNAPLIFEPSEVTFAFICDTIGDCKLLMYSCKKKVGQNPATTLLRYQKLTVYCNNNTTGNQSVHGV